MVKTYSKKLLSQLVGIEKYRRTQILIKDIQKHLMTFELSQLNDQKVEEIANSKWFVSV